MGKVNPLKALPPDDLLTGGIKAKVNSVKSDFSHVFNSNYEDTRLALEAYFISLGVPKHCHVAQLIMLNEKYFAGKYKHGERYHFQQIMPSPSWKKGPTFSEKLTRCKDKATFKGRFDRIGTTAMLSRKHFDNYQIRNLDFKERMYLRLVDTEHGNVSYFFRNDEVVGAFIASAIAFHQQELKAKRDITLSVSAGKPAVDNGGKPAVVYLENPQPLLYPNGVQEKARKNKANSLSLVQPSYGENKPQNQTPKPTDKVEDTEGSGFGFSDQQVMKSVGLCDGGTEQSKIVRRPRSAKPSNGAGTDAGAFKLWHDSVAPKHPEELISAIPTLNNTHDAATICQKFNEFFPAEQISAFFECLAANWKKVCAESFPKWQLKNFGAYPTLSQMLNNWNPLLTWYKNERNRVAKDAEAARVSQELLQQQSQVEFRTSKPRPLAPLIGLSTVNNLDGICPVSDHVA